jgi:hypothetical protein
VFYINRHDVPRLSEIRQPGGRGCPAANATRTPATTTAEARSMTIVVGLHVEGMRRLGGQLPGRSGGDIDLARHLDHDPVARYRAYAPLRPTITVYRQRIWKRRGGHDASHDSPRTGWLPWPPVGQRPRLMSEPGRLTTHEMACQSWPGGTGHRTTGGVA